MTIMDKQLNKSGYLSQAWLVIVLSFLFGGALAGVQGSLGPRIAENRLKETLDVIPVIISGADRSRTVELTVDASDGKPRRVYEAVADDGERKGWVIPAAGPGFTDEIRLLVGLDPGATMITSIYVLDQKETPGLGALITAASFAAQFNDIPTNRALEVVTLRPTAANQIKALTGATISSQSVAAIVNSTVKELKEPLQRRNQSMEK